MNWYKKAQETGILDPNIELLRTGNPSLYELLKDHAPEGLKFLKEKPEKIHEMIRNPVLEQQIKYYLQNLNRNRDSFSPQSFWDHIDAFADKVTNFISTWVLY